jgi:hypothetical protein
MSDVVRNLIQYAGIADHIPESSNVFKQLNIEDTFCLPIEKPNIEQITKVIGEISIKVLK